MCEEKLISMLHNLKIKENRIDTLTEIRAWIDEAESVENCITTSLLKSPEIYDCLEDTKQQEQKNLAIDILSACLTRLSINQEDIYSVLERCLQNKKPEIRAIALNAVLRELKNHPNGSVSDPFVETIINSLDVQDTSVAVPAVEILSIVFANKLDNPILMRSLASKLNKNDVVRCRVYEIAVNLAKISPSNLSKVESLLDAALAELNNNDILVQVTVLEILVSLAEQNHGLIFFEQRRVFEEISLRVDHVEQNPINQLLIPGIMKFFGKVAYLQPQKIITGYPSMVYCLFDCLRSNDISLLPTAFDTLGNVAHSQQGKILLEKNYSENLRDALDGFLTCIRNHPTELKNRAFNTLEIMFSCEGDVSSEASQIMEKWCTVLAGGSNLQFLMDFCTNPFPDIKVSCLNVVRALCHYKWGIMAVKNTAGFVEYLLNRQIEFDKDAKYIKYQIIDLLARSTVFDIQMQLQLKQYVQEGPYYVQSIVEVAIEGS